MQTSLDTKLCVTLYFEEDYPVRASIVATTKIKTTVPPFSIISLGNTILESTNLPTKKEDGDYSREELLEKAQKTSCDEELPTLKNILFSHRYGFLSSKIADEKTTYPVIPSSRASRRNCPSSLAIRVCGGAGPSDTVPRSITQTSSQRMTVFSR